MNHKTLLAPSALGTSVIEPVQARAGGHYRLRPPDRQTRAGRGEVRAVGAKWGGPPGPRRTPLVRLRALIRAATLRERSLRNTGAYSPRKPRAVALRTQFASGSTPPKSSAIRFQSRRGRV